MRAGLNPRAEGAKPLRGYGKPAGLRPFSPTLQRRGGEDAARAGLNPRAEGAKPLRGYGQPAGLCSFSPTLQRRGGEDAQPARGQTPALRERRARIA